MRTGTAVSTDNTDPTNGYCVEGGVRPFTHYSPLYTGKGQEKGKNLCCSKGRFTKYSGCWRVRRSKLYHEWKDGPINITFANNEEKPEIPYEEFLFSKMHFGEERKLINAGGQENSNGSRHWRPRHWILCAPRAPTRELSGLLAKVRNSLSKKHGTMLSKSKYNRLLKDGLSAQIAEPNTIIRQWKWRIYPQVGLYINTLLDWIRGRPITYWESTCILTSIKFIHYPSRRGREWHRFRPIQVDLSLFDTPKSIQ